MPKPRTEEQFPLLLVLVGEQDVSQNNKRLFGRGRFDGITSGATAIITEWPNYLSSCWVTALVCGVTLFFVSVMLSSCMTFQHHTRSPRCSSDSHLIANKTIHLIHTSHKWQPSQLDLLRNITNAFPNYQIHLLVITNKSWKLIKVKRETNETRLNQTHPSLVNASDNTLDDIAKKYPNIIITYKTYRNVFVNSPLFLNWISLNHQMRIFAIRVLEIWQNGGLSYDLLEYKTHSHRKYKNCTNIAEMKVQSYIKSGYKRYEHLQPEVVSIDRNGFHMECKTPCHAFFSKVLQKLRKADENSSPRDILYGPMYTFCKAGVIDKEFCHIQNILF
ncbi:uncharacterized protein LOC135132698 [Zophobas morio]|uniref:uncharacterized protein LOC135132698 n=1 Tax=Zophobas morio TaxID=2755281 RepID=UPI003082EF15